MYEKSLVYFYKLQDNIQEERQRNLWTEQARYLRHRRKHQLSRSAGSYFLYGAKGNLYGFELVYQNWPVLLLRL